jgi:molecular chaperone GrpE
MVIRDRRKIRQGDGAKGVSGKHPGSGQGERSNPVTDKEATTDAAATGTDAPVAADQVIDAEVVTDAEVATDADQVIDAEVVTDDAEVITESAAEAEAPAETQDETHEQTEPAQAGPLGAELQALRSDVDELTRDLQRITAEYANYRKRVERDRAGVVEQATSGLLTALLPVLDDLDRAREHGDLVGPFGSVAEQLIATLTKFGLTPFGEKGDPFDPTRHEAVAHLTSSEVTESTCVDVLRRGYLLGERLLRPALVAVADPE